MVNLVHFLAFLTSRARFVAPYWLSRVIVQRKSWTSFRNFENNLGLAGVARWNYSFGLLGATAA